MPNTDWQTQQKQVATGVTDGTVKTVELKRATYGEAVVWLPEGEYGESQLRQLVDSFDRMREHQKKALGV